MANDHIWMYSVYVYNIDCAAAKDPSYSLSSSTMSTPSSSTSSSKLTWSGSAVVNGRAVLAFRRYFTPATPSNGLLFDVYLYLRGAELAENMTGLCYYFKQSNDDFNKDNNPEVFDITANVCQAILCSRLF